MIVVIGESLVDLLVRPDGRVDATPGGGPFNVARALARLGVPVAFVGRLSTDRFGRILRERLAADGVDLRWTVPTDDPTLLAIAELDDQGTAAYRFHTAETAAPGLTLGDLPDGLPRDMTALHVGTLGLVLEPIAMTIETLVARTGSEVLVVADLNVRPAAIRDAAAVRARFGRLFGRVDLVKASTDDLRWLEPGMNAADAARAIVRRGPAAVLVTDGAAPVQVFAATRVETVPVPSVAVVDTVGAGDAFGAGVLAAWHDAGRGRADLHDVDALVEATRFGVTVGSLTATRAGAEPPTRAQVLSAADPSSILSE
jgi:fructokinase